MIRRMEKTDLDAVMQIWLDGNLDAHAFIPKEYWTGHFCAVREAMCEAEVYVHEMPSGTVDGFTGLSGCHIEGLFVDRRARSQGVGKKLLDFAKRRKPRLTLEVYRRNVSAIQFYLREGFAVQAEEIDSGTHEPEYTMAWEAEHGE